MKTMAYEGRGWGSAPKPLVYYKAIALSAELDKAAHDATAKAWKLTMLTRALRLAETDAEKAKAVADLELYFRPSV